MIERIPKVAPIESRLRRIALIGRASDWKNIIRITKMIAATTAMTHGKRSKRLVLKSWMIAVVPPTRTVVPFSLSTLGMIDARTSAIRWSVDGALSSAVEMTVMTVESSSPLRFTKGAAAACFLPSVSLVRAENWLSERVEKAVLSEETSDTLESAATLLLRSRMPWSTVGSHTPSFLAAFTTTYTGASRPPGNSDCATAVPFATSVPPGAVGEPKAIVASGDESASMMARQATRNTHGWAITNWLKRYQTPS